jgi:hypothetical protein
VFRVPRWAVSFDQTVYAVSNNRLKTVPVQVAYSSGEDAYIAEGLAQGDVVIVTRLIDPLENTLVELTIKNGEV